MKNSKHLDWIDIAKGIGIVLVVLGHTIVPQVRENTFAGFLWIFIYNFHMPLFFFLSGFLFEKGLAHYKSKGKFILGKLKFLMVPYLFFSVFAYVFINIALKINALSPILESGGYTASTIKDAIFQSLTYNNHVDQHLWFVFSLFLVFAINILFPKIMKSKPMIVILLGLYISKAFVQYFGILNYVAGDLFFFSLARMMFVTQPDNKTKNPLLTATVFIITNCIYSYFYITEMPDGVLKGVLYLVRCISSVTGIMTVCAISQSLQSKKISNLFKPLGLYSYDIYLMHAPFLVSGLMGILLSYTSIPAVLCCTIVLIVGIILPYVLSKFMIRKIPFLSTIILGKNFKSTKYSIVKTTNMEV